jgi:5-methylcytosine-specific restriction protein A
MPMAPKHPCNHPGCGVLLERGQTRCLQHQRAYDAQRPTSLERGYTYRWSALSKRFREHWPLCGMLADGTLDTVNSWCAKDGRVTPAQCVQHRVPHKGEHDPLMFDESNLMSSCNRCNNRRRALREPGAFGR